jgi:hypothetical protein
MQLHFLNKYTYLVFAITLTLFYCKKSEPGTNLNPQNTVSRNPQFDLLPESFKKFYQQFHSDSLFQINHIVFPLEGLPDHADPEYIENEPFFWTQDQWLFQSGIHINEEAFSTQYSNLADVLIEEKITDKKNGLVLIRRFANASGGWRLIYYAGMNMYRKNNSN